MQCIILSALLCLSQGNWSSHSLRNEYTFTLFISVGSGSDSIVCGSLSNAVSGPGLDITWEVDGSVSEHWLWFSDRSGLSLTFLTKKLSIVLFIFSRHPRLHQLCLSDWPRLLTSLSVWLQQHTHFQMHTHVQEHLDHGQSEGGVRPSLSLIGLDHDMSLLCVCCRTTWRLSVAETFYFYFFWTARRTGAPSDFF